MVAQGLGALLGAPFSDPLDGRIFGLGVSGAAGGSPCFVCEC